MLITFVAVAQDKFKRDYDASFSIQTTGPVTQQELDQAIRDAIAQFQEYHPGGQIIRKVVAY